MNGKRRRFVCMHWHNNSLAVPSLLSLSIRISMAGQLLRLGGCVKLAQPRIRHAHICYIVCMTCVINFFLIDCSAIVVLSISHNEIHWQHLYIISHIQNGAQFSIIVEFTLYDSNFGKKRIGI